MAFIDLNFPLLFIGDFFQNLSNGNSILLVIGACSVLSFTIFIERLLHLRRSEIDTIQERTIQSKTGKR